MSKNVYDNRDSLLFSVYETHEIVANPTLTGGEANLTGIKIGETKYQVGGGSASNIVVYDYLEQTTEAELTSEQVQDFITNIMDPNKIVKFSNIGGNNNNVTVINVTVEGPGELGELVYYCWCFFDNYFYAVSLNTEMGYMVTTEQL